MRMRSDQKSELHIRVILFFACGNTTKVKAIWGGNYSLRLTNFLTSFIQYVYQSTKFLLRFEMFIPKSFLASLQ